MIRYSLTCDAAHTFESWFRDSDAYAVQADAGLVSCPMCGSTRVSKSIMAPALSRGESRSAERHDEQPPEAEQQAPVALLSEREQKLHALLRSVRSFVEQNSDDVGERFPEEARRIHAGETEARAIRGEAHLDDVRALIEEGIEVLPLPILPEDRN